MSIDVEQLEARLETATDPRERIRALHALCDGLMLKDAARSKRLAEESLVVARELDDQALVGMGQNYLAKALNALGQHDKALAVGLEGLTLVEAYGDERQLLTVWEGLAVIYWRLGQLSDSLQAFLRQLELSTQLKDDHHRAKVLNGLGVIATEMGDLKQGIEYAKQSLAMFRKLGDTYRVGQLLNNISYFYVQLGDEEKVLRYGLEGLKVAEAEDYTNLQIVLSNTVGEMRLKKGEFEAAEAHFERALALLPSAPNPNDEVYVLTLLGELALKREQGELAIEYLEKAVALGEEIGNRGYLYRACELMAEGCAMVGDFAGAYEYYRRFHQVKEEVYNHESDKRLRQLSVQHETEAAKQEAAHYADLYASEQLRRQLTEVLHEVGRVLTRTLELESILDQFLEQLGLVVAYDRGALLLWREERLEFVAVHGYGEANPLGERLMIDVDDEMDVFVRIYRSKRPLAIDDVAAYESWKHVGRLARPQSWLGIPLIHQGEVMGMLSLAREELEPFEEEAQKLAVMFADQAAIAIQNALLYEQIREFNAHLEEMVAQRTADVKTAYAELEKMYRTQMDFIGVTSHELRTPITVLAGYSQLLRRDPVLTGHDKQLNMLAGIVGAAERMSQIVESMLMITKIDSRELSINAEPLSLAGIFGELERELAAVLAERGLGLRVDESVAGLPEVKGDLKALLTVWRQLLTNAIKYTPDGGQITVTGRFDEAHERLGGEAGVEVVVRDTGIGIAAESLELIFEKFYQTGEVSHHSSGQTKFKGGGPGVGLAIARGIVEAHEGRLWAESEGYDEEKLLGSAFYLVLPA
ncbi:MAG TPA: tetratricopeptide repeat protein [Anaerolineae bacterium]|nr:tetratricopeptide repeat protein [Anaerolineae bacterium]